MTMRYTIGLIVGLLAGHARTHSQEGANVLVLALVLGAIALDLFNWAMDDGE